MGGNVTGERVLGPDYGSRRIGRPYPIPSG